MPPKKSAEEIKKQRLANLARGREIKAAKTAERIAIRRQRVKESPVDTEKPLPAGKDPEEDADEDSSSDGEGRMRDFVQNIAKEQAEQALMRKEDEKKKAADASKEDDDELPAEKPKLKRGKGRKKKPATPPSSESEETEAEPETPKPKPKRAPRAKKAAPPAEEPDDDAAAARAALAAERQKGGAAARAQADAIARQLVGLPPSGGMMRF